METAPVETGPDLAPVRRGRRRRRILIALALLVLVVALAPLFLGPVLRPLVVSRIESELDARATVESVGFSWPAHVRVRGLELSDPEGAPLASLDGLDAAVELLPLLGGKLRADVEVAYPEIHLSRAADGRWNWERALSKPKEPEEPEPDDGGEDGELPDVKARVRVADGHVVVHGPGGDTTFGDIELEADVTGLDRPAPFRLSLAARGPEGPAGGVTLEGSFTAATAGKIEPLGFAGELRLALDALDLEGLAPLLASLAPVDALEGTLEGRAELSLGAGLAVSGTADLALRELSVAGPLSGAAPARVAAITLRGNATQQGDGAGSQELELAADSFLTLAYRGRSSAPASGAGEVAGTLSFSADLARASELARGWIELQPGVALSGRVQHEVELSATLADRRPVAASARARGGIEGLAARDGSGRALDLGELEGIALELDASADLARGTVSVPRFSVKAGPVSCEGNVEAAGLALGPGARSSDSSEEPSEASLRGASDGFELRGGALKIEADLERLRGTLAQLVPLEERAFGGTVSVDATLAHRNQALELSAVLDGRGLAYAGSTLSEAHGELDARRSDGGGLSGSGRVRLGALSVAGAAVEGAEPAAPLALPASTLEFGVLEDVARRGEHSLAFRTDDGAAALTLNAKTTRDAGGETVVEASFKLDGKVGPLSELLAPVAPVQAGLAGDLLAQGEAHAVLGAAGLGEASGKLEAFLTDLSARDAAGKPLALEALARTSLSLEARLDARSGRAELRSLALETGGLALRGKATLLGLAPAPGAPPGAAKPTVEDGSFDLEVDLERVGRELARVVDLGGWTLSGSPLSASVAVSGVEERIEARGEVGAARVALARPDGPPIELADLALDFDLGYDAALGSLHVRRAGLSSQTAKLSTNGTLNELLEPARARGAMQLELEGRLERILADLGLEPPEAGRKTSGGLAAKFSLEGDAGAFRVDGRAAIDGFRLELAAAPAAEGEPASAPTVLEEPSIALELEAGVTLARLDVDLERLALESGLARGGAQGRIENLLDADGSGIRFVGLKGDLAYVPDRVGVVLAPLLPGTLTGAEEERITFTLDGKASELDLASILAGTEARVDIGLGLFVRPEVALQGEVVLESEDERVLVRGDLEANGGTLVLDGALDLGLTDDAPKRSKLGVKAQAVRANSGFAPLLALAHPAFGTARLAEGSLEGLVALDLDLSYDAQLSLEQLQAGWASLPKEPISGSGRLGIQQLKLAGSPLLGLLAQFGVDVGRELTLEPIEFTIQKGRVTYAKPWTWTFSGTTTTFTGSLGLDETLDLAWNVPITERLIERWSFLSALKGETISIPLRGTVKSPRLDVDDLMKDLAAKAAKAELGSRIGLGGGKDGSEDPAAMLKRADELWSKNQKAEAAAIYMRLREDFKLSLTYALNKDRIKERSKYEPPK